VIVEVVDWRMGRGKAGQAGAVAMAHRKAAVDLAVVAVGLGPEPNDDYVGDLPSRKG
jgi:hypothetical protein